MKVGQIRELWRYPVKSMAGERLNKVSVAPYGLFGDRSLAFVDETRSGWERFVTARTIPSLVGYRVEWPDEACGPDGLPAVTIVSPEGREFGWDERLLADVQSRTGVKLSMADYSVRGSGPLAADAESVLIVTDESLRELERMWGKPLDSRRFRANIHIALESDIPFAEADWIGKSLTIGDVCLSVREPCERCMFVTIDPETLEKDSSLLRLISEERLLKFGVYASVVRTGTISAGDPVSIAD